MLNRFISEITKEKIKRLIPPERLFFDEPMSDRTSFKTGGKAECIVISDYEDEILQVILLAGEEDIPYYIFGNMTNVLVADEGLGGIVLLVKNPLSRPEFKDEGDKVSVFVPAGCPLTRLAMEASRNGYGGLEFAAGIPGSVGGAVIMNAGAYGGEINDVITRARVLDCNAVPPVFKTYEHDGLELGYRRSAFSNGGFVVTGAEFMLEKGDSEAILATVTELNEKRRTKQPLEFPSAGSTFKRPEGYYAGKLIEDAGLKGFSVGDACVSEKHSGFVINRGHASSADILKLIVKIRQIVFEKFGVVLEPEVKMIGFDEHQEDYRILCHSQLM